MTFTFFVLDEYGRSHDLYLVLLWLFSADLLSNFLKHFSIVCKPHKSLFASKFKLWVFFAIALNFFSNFGEIILILFPIRCFECFHNNLVFTRWDFSKHRPCLKQIFSDTSYRLHLYPLAHLTPGAGPAGFISG